MASEAPSAFASQCVPFSKVPGSCSNPLDDASHNSIVGPNLVNLDFPVHKDFAPPLPFLGPSNAQIFNANGTPSGGGGLQQPLVTKPRDTQLR
jgi:hypothetical protein